MALEEFIEPGKRRPVRECVKPAFRRDLLGRAHEAAPRHAGEAGAGTDSADAEVLARMTATLAPRQEKQ